jgi:hypothetical protein
MQGDKTLLLCQDERAKASQAPMSTPGAIAHTEGHVGLSLRRQHASPC